MCAVESDERIPPGLCPKCGNVETYERLEVFEPARLADTIPSVMIPRIPTNEKRVDDLLWGGFPVGGRVIIWGKGGTGKSRVSLRWFTQLSNCLYVSLDMAEPILLMSAKSCGANLKQLFIVEKHAFFERAAREDSCRIVIIDAISDIEDRKERRLLLADLKAWVSRGPRIAVLICHENKKGQHAGSYSLQHWPDFELKLTAAKKFVTVSVLKSRTCPTGYCRTQLTDNRSENESDDESPDSPL